MLKHFLFIFSFIALAHYSPAQTEPFQIAIEPFYIQELGGIQSFAFGQHDGKWLVIGGRLDGLHRRQPFAAFDLAGHNTQLIIVDPKLKKKWSANLTSLPIDVQDQLASTNMQFHQIQNTLYLTGGYGYSRSLGDHTTFSYLIAVDVSGVIQAVINDLPIESYFRKFFDPMFQVAGGHLKVINQTFYLIGGHTFIGRYNPMGPDHGPGFIQQYTNQIRKFRIIDDGTTITVAHLTPITDSVNLHRRDYNAVPQILPNGKQGITAFSGVFQPIIDLPYLNCVDIDSSGYMVNNTFQQLYNHYHCAVLPVYSESANEMHNIFFGGIAQFYERGGQVIKDDNVPFVKTIARVTRDANGSMKENKLSVEMPAFLGAGSEFIPIKELSHFPNEVIKLDELDNDTSLVGYIYGGISSTEENIFFSNDGSQSSASHAIFKVYIIKNEINSTETFHQKNVEALNLKVYPNPGDGELTVEFYLKTSEITTLTIFTLEGKKIRDYPLGKLPNGKNELQIQLNDGPLRDSYIVELRTPSGSAKQQLIFK